MTQNYHSLWSHLIWSTKHRERLITKDIKWTLYQKIKQICEENDYFLDHINGTEDHIHLLIELKPKFSISDVVKNIKGISWQWMRKGNLAKGYFSWQDGFAAISVSPAELDRVRQYIRNQETHHQNKTFEDEIKLLRQFPCLTIGLKPIVK